MQKERLEEARVKVIRLDWTKLLENAKEFLSKEKSAFQWTVKDYDVVMKSLCRDNSKKAPKMKKPLLELHQKWKERTTSAVDQMAGPDPDSMCDDAMDEMMMEAKELLDTDKGFVQPCAVDEVAGPAPNNACEEGMDEMIMEATELLDADEGFVTFQAI